MKKKSNKTAKTFLYILFYIIKNCNFTIDEIVDFLEKEHNISIKYLTVLKYIRTMKKLNYKFAKNNCEYRLVSTPFNLDLKHEEVSKFFGSYLNIMNKYDYFAQEQSKILYSKLAPFLKLQNIKSLDKLYLSKKISIKRSSINLEKITEICKEKTKIKIKYNENNKNFCYIIEPNRLVIENDEYFIYAFNLKKNIYELLNIKNIVSYERLHQKNQHTYKKQSAKLLLRENLAKSYTPKRDEKIFKNDKNEVIMTTYFYDKELFFRRILRYQDTCKIISPDSLKKEYLHFVKNLYDMYVFFR